MNTGCLYLCGHMFSDFSGRYPGSLPLSFTAGCVGTRGSGRPSAGAVGTDASSQRAGQGGFWEGAAAAGGPPGPLSTQEEDFSEQGLIRHTKDLGTGGLLVRRDPRSGAGGCGPIASFLPPAGLPPRPTWDTSPGCSEWQPGSLTSCCLASPEQRKAHKPLLS